MRRAHRLAVPLVCGVLAALHARSGASPAPGAPRAMSADHAVLPTESLAAAIDAAPDGAVLTLAPGRHDANLVLHKNVTLRGAGAAADVVLDGQGRGTIIQVAGQQTSLRLEHLTLTRGGGAAAALSSSSLASVELTDVVVRDNTAGHGTAVRVTGGKLLVDRCRFSGNTGDFGAVLLIDSIAHATIRRSLIVDNTGSTSAIAVRDLAQLTLDHATVAGNRAPIAVELRGTPGRMPKLEVRDSIIANAGGTTVANGPRLPGHASVQHAILEGATTGEIVSTGVRTDAPRFVGQGAEAYRPAVGSPALELAAASGEQDLTGASIGRTAGALAPAR